VNSHGQHRNITTTAETGLPTTSIPSKVDAMYDYLLGEAIENAKVSGLHTRRLIIKVNRPPAGKLYRHPPKKDEGHYLFDGDLLTEFGESDDQVVAESPPADQNSVGKLPDDRNSDETAFTEVLGRLAYLDSVWGKKWRWGEWLGLLDDPLKCPAVCHTVELSDLVRWCQRRKKLRQIPWQPTKSPIHRARPEHGHCCHPATNN
jgi:hypothetical protein